MAQPFVIALVTKMAFACRQAVEVVAPNKRFERDAPTAGFAACFRAPQAKRWATTMHTFISLCLLFSISMTASAGILQQEHREQLIQGAFANFWGKARLSNGNPVQPDNAAERSTLPISSAAANHVISVGELSGIAEWCGMDWQTHFRAH